MLVKKYSIKNQQKMTVGILNAGFYRTFKWFHQFDSVKETICKVELSDMDIEKIFAKRLFFKNDLTDCEYVECILEDILDWNIFIPYQVTNMQLGHRILLKRKLTPDNLHVVIYCFKGTLKAIERLLEANKLTWTSKERRTKLENKIISIQKYKRDLTLFEIEKALINDLDYEVIERIYDIETMELLLENEEIPFKDLIAKRLCEFTESQDMNSKTYVDDY